MTIFARAQKLSQQSVFRSKLISLFFLQRKETKTFQHKPSKYWRLTIDFYCIFFRTFPPGKKIGLLIPSLCDDDDDEEEEEEEEEEERC